MSPNGAFLTAREVAGRLGLAKPDLILAAIHAGELMAVNVSRPGAKRRTWRIPVSAFDAFLRRRTAVPTPTQGHRRRRERPAGVTEYF